MEWVECSKSLPAAEGLYLVICEDYRYGSPYQLAIYGKTVHPLSGRVELKWNMQDSYSRPSHWTYLQELPDGKSFD